MTRRGLKTIHLFFPVRLCKGKRAVTEDHISTHEHVTALDIINSPPPLAMRIANEHTSSPSHFKLVFVVLEVMCTT